ncbi:MAG: molecular chaperone HtpG, partial [Clostridia bacterium]|nr:molecular chaperone HtpG [Clostridia bacterium]
MSENNEKMRGGISVDTEHLFPIIKKWLYSDKEIFLREIVSNASDAVTKLRRLISLAQAPDTGDDYRITVRADEEEGTLTVSDNGIGMNEDEIRRYICQIALSGALDFIEKYEGGETGANGIIGHFGLGFYSAFMVSDRVDVISRSWDGSPAIGWSCNQDGEYEIMPEVTREGRGTDVIMHLSEDEREYLSEHKLREVLDKYCAFVPVDIYLEIAKDEEKEGEKEEAKPVNDTHPLWLKNAGDCTDEEYKSFYSKVFTDYREPLFHIHINADYPLNFKGILYFPKLNANIDGLDGQIKLYYNQVFVSDSIKELLPDYLLMLRGVIDCPELPLNVSRSYMQNSAYAKKLAAHITKKVADKINSLFNTDREAFEKLWRDLKTFVEYGCLRDRKFYDKVKDSVLFEKCGGGFATLTEYLESAKETNENKVYYATDKTAQAQYISLLQGQNIEVVLLDRILDTQFVQMLESQNSGVKFVRVDAEIAGAMTKEAETPACTAARDLFDRLTGENVTVEVQTLKDSTVPAILTVSEESRRMDDMMKMYAMANEGMDGSFPLQSKLILNASSPLIASWT